VNSAVQLKGRLKLTMMLGGLESIAMAAAHVEGLSQEESRPPTASAKPEASTVQEPPTVPHPTAFGPRLVSDDEVIVSNGEQEKVVADKEGETEEEERSTASSDKPSKGGTEASKIARVHVPTDVNIEETEQMLLGLDLKELKDLVGPGTTAAISSVREFDVLCGRGVSVFFSRQRGTDPIET
jgi:hypothetical protein